MLLAVIAATALTLLIAAAVAITARLLAILPPRRARPNRRRSVLYPTSGTNSPKTTRSRRLERASRDEGMLTSPDYPYRHIMVVLGSGGHTAEMLLMLQTVGMGRWRKRTWVVSSGDGFSAGLAGDFEARLKGRYGGFGIVELPRARRVHQSLLTAPFSSLVCLWAAMKTVANDAPDVVLTNGPGTGVIVVLSSLILRFLGLAGSARTRCVYLESLARCRKLSLSGRLLRGVVDRFLVQWPELKSSNAEFRGCFALDAAIGVGIDEVEDVKELDEQQWICYDL